MNIPLTLVAATVLAPIAATTVLSLGLIASASAFALSKSQGQIPLRSNRSDYLNASSRNASLHDNLRLDACQDTLWTKAERADSEMSNDLLGRLREKYDETLALLKEPGVDLSTVTKRMEAFLGEERNLRQAVSERWHAVYGTLDDRQKNQAHHFFKSKLEQNGRPGVWETV